MTMSVSGNTENYQSVWRQARYDVTDTTGMWYWTRCDTSDTVCIDLQTCRYKHEQSLNYDDHQLH